MNAMGIAGLVSVGLTFCFAVWVMWGQGAAAAVREEDPQPAPAEATRHRSRAMRLLGAVLFVVGGLAGALAHAIATSSPHATPVDPLGDALAQAAYNFSRDVDDFEESTRPGAPCPDVNGPRPKQRDDANTYAGRKVRSFEAAFTNTVIVFDVYKTKAGPSFNATAERFDAWKEGPRARALDSCWDCTRPDGIDDSCRVGE